MPHSPQTSPFLVASSLESGDLAEEESGLRTRSADDRAREALGIAEQLDREAAALVRGLEALRFALHARTGPRARQRKAHAQGLANVRDGYLHVLGAAATTPRLFREGSAFVEYLRGLAAWAHATLEAVGDEAREQDSAHSARHRLELAKSLHFDELECEVIRELRDAGSYDPSMDALQEAMGRLYAAARALESRF